MNFEPIGLYHSQQKKAYEAGRQPDPMHAPGIIKLNAGRQFEQALLQLETFSHLWVLFAFHHNSSWKPMVRPPRGSLQKVGVFATRSPYRPNNIGMSVLKIQKISGLNIYVTEGDLLDGSPILDIKPYLPYADIKNDANQGWIPEQAANTIIWSEKAQMQLQWLAEHLPLLKGFILHQLEYDATASHAKRVKLLHTDIYCLAYKTWRIDFKYRAQNVEILQLRSGYSASDLNDSQADKYKDKNLHRLFVQRFNS